MLGWALTACVPPDEPEDVGASSRVAIGPEGGLVTSEDGVLTISIRPGALEKTHIVTIETSDEPPAVFSQAYTVRPNVALALAASVTFAHMLPDALEEAAVGAVSRSTYEAGEGRWAPLPTARVEPGRITAVDHELSVFYGVLDLAENEP